MGFSSHEIYMILRARDEATRLVRNVSNALAKTDAGRAMQQVNNIRTVQQAEMAAHKERIGRYGVYASEHSNALDVYSLNVLKLNESLIWMLKQLKLRLQT